MADSQNIRLLAAVMFADMVGYTKMMQQDESLAKSKRDRQRTVVDSKILEFRGQVMQYYGDGTLSMFASAIDAVNAAKEIQLELQKDPEVPMRIGIHLGDVVYDDEGIYGDAVNIAARVQGLGTPGSVMVSGKVFDEIKNHPGIRVEAFGEHELKNVFQTTSIFALANEGLEIPPQRHIQEITGTYQNSVAVLPFANFSGDPNDEYFADGITEEIINALVKVSDLEVASRTSVFGYKNLNKDIREIGKELNVAAVLEGSVRKAGNRIRVTAQLINTDDGFHIWSENFDGEMKDIFEVQDEISQKIVEKLEADSFFSTSGKLYEASTDSIVAYNYYLEGLFYWNKRSPESIFKAMELFEKAINYCSTYTNAFSALANCYTYLGAVGQMDSKKAFGFAEEYANKSLELNGDRSESYTALGFVNMIIKWNFDDAEANFRKAITLEPNDSSARLGLSYLYRAIGDFKKMHHQIKAAVTIDPLSLPAKLDLGYSHLFAGKYEEAQYVFDEMLALDPVFRSTYEALAFLNLQQGNIDEAVKYADQYISLVTEKDGGAAFLGYIAAVKGDQVAVSENLEKLEQRQAENPELNLDIDFAIIHAANNDYDAAFKYIDTAVEQRIGAIIFINTYFPFQRLKEDPRFSEVLRTIGIPEHQPVEG